MLNWPLILTTIKRYKVLFIECLFPTGCCAKHFTCNKVRIIDSWAINVRKMRFYQIKKRVQLSAFLPSFLLQSKGQQASLCEGGNTGFILAFVFSMFINSLTMGHVATTVLSILVYWQIPLYVISFLTWASAPFNHLPHMDSDHWKASSHESWRQFECQNKEQKQWVRFLWIK